MAARFVELGDRATKISGSGMTYWQKGYAGSKDRRLFATSYTTLTNTR